MSQRSCAVLVRGRSPSDTRIRGEIFTDYYFGEANTANKSDNHHSNAINENLNWGGFSGCYSSLPPTVDLVPRSCTVRGGRGAGGEARDDEELNTANKDSTPRRTTNSCREDSAERQRRRKTRSSKLQEEE